jgi:hypothetical protein
MESMVQELNILRLPFFQGKWRLVILGVSWVSFLFLCVCLSNRLSGVMLPLSWIRAIDTIGFILSLVCVLSAFWVVLTFGFHPFYKTLRKKGKQAKIDWGKIPIASIIFFIFLMPTVFLLEDIADSSKRNIVKNFLISVTSDVEVRIDGARIACPMSVINELIKVRHLPAHHSHPTREIPIEIIDDDRHLSLKVARDSGVEREYWVFYSFAGSSSRNHIGNIITNVFSNY